MGLFDGFKKRKKDYKEVAADNTKLSERDMLINKIGSDKIQYICDMYMIKKDNLSIDFLTKLASSEEIINFLTQNFLTSESIQKMNNNNFSLNDALNNFQYDILRFPVLFKDDEKNKILLLNKEIKVSQGNYVSVQMDEFNLNNLSLNEEYDTAIQSYFSNVTIKKDSKKILSVKLNDIYSISDINMLFPSNNIYYNTHDFSYCVDNSLQINDKTIVVISSEKFKALTEIQVENLKNCIVVLKEDINKINKLYDNFRNKSFNDNFPALENDNLNNELIKTNHLLYIVNNSNLDSNRKKYFEYWIKKYYKNNSLPYYVQEFADKLTKEIGIDEIKRISYQFDDLEYNKKINVIELDNYDVSIFLGEFENIDNVNLSTLINAVSKLNSEEKEIVLGNFKVKNKLASEILNECSGDIYSYFESLKLKLSVTEILSLLDVKKIKDNFIGDKKYLEYKLFASLCRSEVEVNETVSYLLNNDEMFIEFFKQSTNFYSALESLNGKLLIDTLTKLKQNNMDTQCYDFVSCLSLDTQKELIDEKLDDEIISILIPKFRIDAVNYFFKVDNRANYLFKNFDMQNFVRTGVIFNDTILRSNEFFDMLKSKSFVDFRTNINNVEVGNSPEFIEIKLKKYYDAIFNDYDENKGMFKEYIEILAAPDVFKDYKKFNNYILDDDAFQILNSSNQLKNGDCIDMFKKLTNQKISEVLVDALFADNIYNVQLNIKEMFRFNSKLNDNEKVIDTTREQFYKMILNIDNVPCTDKIKLYRELKDKNINLMFYEDLRKLKDKSYNLIKSELFDFKNNGDSYNEELSNKYGTSVYDMRNKDFFMLVRAENGHRDKDRWRRNCYSIISDDNTDVFGHGSVNIYGYNSFENDRVLHMFEGDAFSGDENKNFGSRERVNRIMTPEELANSSSWYSEIQLVNIKDSNSKNTYFAKKPDFIVVYNKPSEGNIRESKERGISIVIINEQRLKDDKKIDIDKNMGMYDDIYINNSYDEENSDRKAR